MATHSVAERPRRSTVDSDDALAMRAAELAAWARRNARVIMGVAVAALVLVGGFLYYQLDQGRRAARASSEYLSLQATLQSVADSNAAVRQVEAFANKYAGTPEAAEARLQLGEQSLQRGQAKKAIEYARPVAEGGTPLAFQGRMMLAAALAADGKRDEAVRTYLEAGDKSELTYQKQEALNIAALLREQSGDHKGALELYRRLLALTEEGSMERGIIELRVAEAEARTGAAPAAAKQ